MRPDDVMELLRQKPFRPFRIYLSDGTVYTIRHPDQVAVGRSALALALAASDDPDQLVDPVLRVALLHITRLEPIVGSVSSSSA